MRAAVLVLFMFLAGACGKPAAPTPDVVATEVAQALTVSAVQTEEAPTATATPTLTLTPSPPMPTPFYVVEIADQGEGGEQTRIFVYVAEDGTLMISEEAGYRYDLSFSMSSPVSGSMIPSYWLAGAEQIFQGKIHLGEGLVFDGDPAYPLTFKLAKDQGLQYMCGRGTIRRQDGTTVKVGYEDTIDTWLPRLNSGDTIVREAAAQALGWLAVVAEEKQQVVEPLLAALEDEAWEVRRNAAEALGRIKDLRAAESLLKHTLSAGESDEWVREVAAEAYTSVTGIDVTPEPTQEPEVTSESSP